MVFYQVFDRDASKKITGEIESDDSGVINQKKYLRSRKNPVSKTRVHVEDTRTTLEQLNMEHRSLLNPGE